MRITKVSEKDLCIELSIPLTTATGKSRIKKRSIIHEYGVPVATRQEILCNNCYVEWQIGYDVLKDGKEKIKLTTLSDTEFVGSNGKKKALYELSEIIYYFTKWNIIKIDELKKLKIYLESLNKEELIDVNPKFGILRSHPIEKEVLGINFLYSQVQYPLLIYKFNQYEIIAEIIIKEKQYAVGVQPMLYFCFPVSEIAANPAIVGRATVKNEQGIFVINQNNCTIFLEILKIFGILSESHRKDILSIIELITSSS